MSFILQVWERINDKVNNGVQRDLPSSEFMSWFTFRKLENSNKIVKEDLRKSVQKFVAAFIKGKAWLRTSEWASTFKSLQAMSNAVYKLQVYINHS